MVTAIILILLALVLILIWMIVITILYCHIAKAQRILKQSLFKSVRVLEANQQNILDALDYFLYYFENLTGDAEDLYKEASAVLEIANDKAIHARETVQAVRKLKQQIDSHKAAPEKHVDVKQEGESGEKNEEDQSETPADTPQEE